MASKECIFDASITENEKPDLNVLEAVENVGESERVLPTVEEERENNMFNETLSPHSRGECVSQLQRLLCFHCLFAWFLCRGNLMTSI